MDDVNLHLTNDEKRTRFQWLVGFLTMVTFGLVSQIYDLFSMQNTYKAAYGAYALHVQITMFVIIAVITWVQYHCIYVKQGTRWLTFLIFILPLNFFMLIYPMLNPNPAIPISNWRLGASLLVVGVYWILCIKLRKVNKRIQSLQTKN